MLILLLEEFPQITHVQLLPRLQQLELIVTSTFNPFSTDMWPHLSLRCHRISLGLPKGVITVSFYFSYL
jgi:hypothetical protein